MRKDELTTPQKIQSQQSGQERVTPGRLKTTGMHISRLKPGFVLTLVFCMLLTIHARAQDKHAVTGKVVDEVGQPLAGVSIILKSPGTEPSQGTVTEDNGSYEISAGSKDSLIFKYIGFADQRFAVSAKQLINVTLKAANSDLEGVVVIGYQAVLKKDLTGATGVVDMENADRVSAGSVGESIQGLVPGVTVRNGGAPGQNSAIEIRGVGSFGNASPLYVIDGMIANANVTINPDDVATIQILKDASAAAIYGSRAGNGVVIITTKKGKNGPPVISVSGKYGMQQLPKTWNVMDAPAFLQTAKQQYANSGSAMPGDIASQLENNTINTDWQDAVYRNSTYQDYNLSVSGGSENAHYFISGGYNQNEGTVVANNFTRASLRINTEIKKGILTFGENLMISATNDQAPGGGVNVFYEAAQMLPIIKTQSEEYSDPNLYPSNPAGWGMGSSNNPTYASNYLANAAIDKVTNEYGKLVGNAYLSLQLLPWLSYKFNAGLEVSYDYTKNIRDTGIWRYTSQPAVTFVSEGRSRYTNLLLEHTLNFNKTFGLHKINGVVGFSRAQQGREFTNGSRSVLQNLNGNLYTTIGSALGDPSADGGLINKWRNHGWLGRVNYSYDERYLLTLTGRIDQDSRFGPNYRTGYFPSVAGAWRLSKEDFFKASWVDDLKIRASYGRLGFSDVLSAWNYLGFVNSSSRAIYGTGQSPHIGQYQANITNPDLHWETRKQTNIGADASMFNNALTVSVDWYNSTSDEVLVNIPLPQYLGSSGSPYVNTGSIRNTGIELSLSYRNNHHDLKWNISGNLTTIKNKVLSVGNQGTDASGNKVDYLQANNFIRTQVGHAMASWFVIETNGLFQTTEEVDNYKNSEGKIIQPDAKPGDVKYVDLNDDGQINDNDRSYHGSPWPTLQSGLQFNATYHRFNLNLQFVGIFGNKIYNGVRRNLDGYQLSNFRDDVNPWTPENTHTNDPRLAIDDGNDPSVSANNMAQTDRWLENGSYVRLRNIEIGYSFTPAFLKKISVNKASILLSGQNLFTITKYTGLDPDIANGNVLMRGMDSGFWPSSRIYSVGLHFEF